MALAQIARLDQRSGGVDAAGVADLVAMLDEPIDGVSRPPRCSSYLSAVKRGKGCTNSSRTKLVA